MNFRIWFTDETICEFHDVVNRRKMWRMVSKYCKWSSTPTRVLKVELFDKEAVRRMDEKIENLWLEFEDIPCDEDEIVDDLVIAVKWNGFPAGTTREEIWHWFDEQHSKGVAYLMYDYEG